MEAIVRKEAERCTRCGKESAFTWHGRPVDRQKIGRYRKAKRLTADDQALGLRAPSPDGLVCYTPQLASQPTTPRQFAFLERFMRLGQTYIDGSFDKGSWYVDDDLAYHSRRDTSTADHLGEWLRLLFHHAWTGNFGSATQAMNISVIHFENAILREDPDLLHTLQHMVRSGMILAPISVTENLLGYISRLSAILLGPQHPFAQFCGYLTVMCQGGQDKIEEN